MKVRDVMTKNVTFLKENNTVKEAASQMRSLNVGSMPVCNNTNTPVGVITDRDIVLRNVSEGRDSNMNIQDIMTDKVVSVSPETDIHEAANIMAQNQVRRLPVVENNQLVGIVSIGDLAVRNIYVNEAGTALSSISQPSRPLR
ncbi:MAG: CBS domain-containing protein [Firmicutes bacterium]|nr:CBS domain-containing protein [Bacillota bacterium]